MRFVFVSYHYSADIHSPAEWVNRLRFYIGSLELLAKTNTVIRIDQINYKGNFTHNGVQYYCIKDRKGENFLPLKLHRFVKSLQPDIIVVSSLLYPLQVIQLRYSLGKKVKIILQNHAERPSGGIKRFIQRLADKYVNAYFFASREMGLGWVKLGNLSSINKIYEIMEVSSVFYPIDKTVAKLHTGVNGNYIFLWVGRLNINKDPLTVVKTFLTFVQKYAQARLYMIYQTTELLVQVQKLLAKENYHSPVILIGGVAHTDMLYWFNSADFILSGSHYEGSGTAVCEAMSCGCIPIVTNIFSYRTITSNGDCGVLYTAGDEQALLIAMEKAINLNLSEQSIKALAQFNKELSFEIIANKIEKVAASL